MFTIIGDLLTWILGFVFHKADPKIQDIAASNATAQTQLVEQENANATLVKAAAARTDADATVVREQAAHKLDSDPAGHWRD